MSVSFHGCCGGPAVQHAVVPRAYRTVLGRTRIVVSRQRVALAEWPRVGVILLSNPLSPGDLIQSRYRLIRLLGAGASGAVWAARNELIDRDVALKIMRPEVAEDAVALQRFFNEAKASGRVRSPSIVEIFDLGQAEDGSPFLVFELLEGEGLDERLRRERDDRPPSLCSRCSSAWRVRSIWLTCKVSSTGTSSRPIST